MQNYNLIQHIDVVSQGATEPVTLADVKNWLRINSIDESDSTQILSEDALLLELITAAREEMENYCGLSLITKTIKVTLTNYCGNIELPGPVLDTTAITALDRYGNAIPSTSIVYRGKDFPVLECPTDLPSMSLQYNVGYATLPKSLKNDLLRKIAYMWMYRGDDNAPDFKYTLSSKYMRNTWLH